VCCRVLQSVAECCSALHCIAVCCRKKEKKIALHNLKISIQQEEVECVAECCRVLQCVAVCCTVLQCVAGKRKKR